MSQNILETRDSPLNKNFTESFLKDSFELNYENAQRQTNNFSFELLFLPYLINTFFLPIYVLRVSCYLYIFLQHCIRPWNIVFIARKQSVLLCALAFNYFADENSTVNKKECKMKKLTEITMQFIFPEESWYLCIPAVYPAVYPAVLNEAIFLTKWHL